VNPAAGKTVRESLRYSSVLLRESGVEQPLREAQLIMAWAIDARREDLVREPDRSLNSRESLMFEKAVTLRCARRPLPYLTGERWFYGRSFKVNRAVLIPRPETELLVDFALMRLRNKSAVVADIGTGSGCIGVTVACEVPAAHVVASDLSPLGVLVARKNSRRHAVSNRVLTVRGDLMRHLVPQSVDMILSNPPYIDPAEKPFLMPEVRDYEPELALYGPNDNPTWFHSALLSDAVRVLKPGGWIALEVGIGQAELVAETAQRTGFRDISILSDLGGIGRVVAGCFVGTLQS